MVPEIEFDETKRLKVLRERGLDFLAAWHVFSGMHFSLEDKRIDYGEARFITIGMLKTRLVVIVWTLRGAKRRIISMRKANERASK